jgi:Ca-activated chloride channel family protein
VNDVPQSAGIHLQDPLWLLLLFALVAVSWLRRRWQVPAVLVPEAGDWEYRHGVLLLPPWPLALGYVGLALLVIGLARPQMWVELEDESRVGYDVMIAIDLSTSMHAEDFRIGGVPANRLQALKPIISAFINDRPDDRIGIVVFAGRAYTFAPLTFDHDWLRKQTARLSIGLIEDGTAIGDAIGLALNRLREGWKDETRHREGSFIVLLTDGSSNKGALDPRQAAALAAADGIVIYAIGAGAEGPVEMPTFDYAGNRTGTDLRESTIDTLLLRDLAENTGGQFFRAIDENAVADAFERIDQAQGIVFDTAPPIVSHELFQTFSSIGVVLLAFAFLGLNSPAIDHDVP